MDFNPHARRYTELEKEVDDLKDSGRIAWDELEWYRNVDCRALNGDLRENESKAAKLKMDVATLEKEIAANNDQLTETAPAIGTLLNPTNWFSSDQVALRRRCAALREAGERKTAQKQSKVRELADFRGRIDEIRSLFQRYYSFDVDLRQRDLFEIKQRFDSKLKELEVVGGRKKEVDEILAPLIHEMQRLESRKHLAESRLRRAEDFERRLSGAGNSYERALIHEKCEGELGNGKPRSVIAEQQKEIRQIDRDYGKAKHRAEEIAGKAARIIETIVVDGNNLCYEGSSFIGLSAVETLVPILSRNRSVIVVFDSTIRRMLKTDDSQIRQRLSEYATVHCLGSAGIGILGAGR